MRLVEELGRLFSSRSGELESVCSIKSVNERIDGLTLLCRDVLRSSSLCVIGGVIHYFGGRYYEVVGREVVLSSLGNVLVDSGVSPTDVRRMSDMPLSVIVEKVYESRGMIAFENGVFDIESGEFVEGFDRSKIVTEALPYAYDAYGACPMWESFLSEVMPDESMRRVLQEFFGCCYVDRSSLSIEKFGIFLGAGANGKSVIREVVSRAMGKSNVASYDAEQITRSELQPYLNGKRINFASDMKVSAAFDSALKALASGQEVIGRKIYGEPVVVKAPPIVFSMNQLPPFRDTSDAFFRRVLLFRFDVVIPEGRRDASLAERICGSELPGVFHWLMEGRRRILGRKGVFSPCSLMDGALASLRADVPDAKYPVKSYLESRGYSVVPLYSGQPFSLVSQNEIDLGLRSTVSRHCITSELRRFGVQTFRSKELFYKVYRREK